MLDLSLTDEQKAFRDALRKFADKEIAPLVAEYEEGQSTRSLYSKRLENWVTWGPDSPRNLGGAGEIPCFP